MLDHSGRVVPLSYVRKGIGQRTLG